MKNYFYSAIIAGAALFLASCDKEVESTDLKVDLARTIDVKGYVYAELDKTKAGWEFAPAGTKIRLSVDYSDFGTASTGKWLQTVEVDENGLFSATIPVDDDGVNLKIEPIAFDTTQINSYGSNNPTLEVIFTAPTKTVFISTSVNAIEEIFYVDAPISSQVEYAEITFKVEADLDLSLVGNEKVANQTLVLFNSGWKQNYTTNADGEFVAKVPANEAISMEILFVYDKKVPDGANFIVEKYEYKLNGGVGTFSAKGDATVDLGGGTKVE